MNDEANKVTIKTGNTKNDAGELEPYIFTVHQHGLQHGHFTVNDFDTPEEAKAAAEALAEQLKATPWVSPFVKYRDTILADYGTAAKIRRFVLSLYNGYYHPADLSDIAGMDKRHLDIVLELMTSYHALGENDKSFLRLAEEIKKEFGGILSGNITSIFTREEIKELDDAVYLALRRMLREGLSAAERNDGSVKVLVSAITKIHEQGLGGTDTPRMQDIRQMIAKSDVKSDIL